MAKGYWIGRVDVHDAEQYQKYIDSNGEAFTKYGAKFLIRGGQFETAEGTSRSRNVVIEFKDYQTAVDCYHSPEYAAAKAHRFLASDADIIIIEGYDL
ncbi:MAG: DUF1330 domain-containing protein [Cohaesibacter sp.]|jgi:uncharacterized protein (DUF1330 family)|nr:DUF1330 domain-containing protein [Cohaesibacter sp.]